MSSKRKTLVSVKSLPEAVEWILKNANGGQLDFLNYIGKHPDFLQLVKLIGLFKEYNIYEVFNFKARNAEELMFFRAAKRGETAGLDALILSFQAASEEIKRRRDGK